jgi:hypothetical protein
MTNSMPNASKSKIFATINFLEIIYLNFFHAVVVPGNDFPVGLKQELMELIIRNVGEIDR